MSTEILDLNEIPLTNFGFAQPFLEDKLWDIKVICKNGLFLKSVDGVHVFYFGRFAPADSWVSLSSPGLDLSAFNGIMKIIHIKITNNENATPHSEITSLYLA